MRLKRNGSWNVDEENRIKNHTHAAPAQKIEHKYTLFIWLFEDSENKQTYYLGFARGAHRCIYIAQRVISLESDF